MNSLLESFRSHLPIYAIAFDVDDVDLVWIGQGRMIEAWSISKGQPQRVISTRSTVRGIIALIDGKKGFIVFGGRELCCFYKDDSRPTKYLTFLDAIIEVKIYEDVIYVVLGHGQGKILHFNGENLIEVASWKSPNDSLLYSALIFSPPSQSFTRQVRSMIFIALGTIFDGIDIYELDWNPTQLMSSQVVHLNRLSKLSGPAGHKGSIFGMAICPRGKLLASVSDDRTIKVWAVGDRKDDGYTNPRFTFTGHRSRIWSCIFADPNTLLTSGEDGTVRSYNLLVDKTSGDEGQLLLEMEGSVWAMAKGADRIASGSDTGALQINYLQSATHTTVQIKEFPMAIDHEQPKYLALIPDDLIILYADGHIGGNSVEPTGNNLLTKHAIFHIVNIPNAENVIVAGNLQGNLMLFYGNEFKIFDLGFTSQVVFLQSHVPVPSRNAFTTLAQAGDGAIKIVSFFKKESKDCSDLWMSESLCTLPIHSTIITSACFLSENRLLFGSRDGRLVFWDGFHAQLLKRFGRDAITCIRPYNNGWLLTDRSGTLSFVQMNGMELITNWSQRLTKGWLEQVELVQNGRVLLVAGFHSTRFFVMEVQSEREIFSTETGGAHRVWKLIYRKSLEPLGDCLRFAFIRLGRIYEASIPIVSANALYLKKPLHGDIIRALVYYNNEKKDFQGLVSASEDGKIKYVPSKSSDWYLAGSHEGDIKALAHRGNLIFSAGSSGRLRGWKARPELGQPFTCVFDAQVNIIEGVRFMDVDVIETPQYLVAVAGSDSYIRIFSPPQSDKEIGRIVPHPFRCVLKCRWLVHDNNIYLLSGATDGKLALSQWRRVNEIINGDICTTLIVHQSGINALALYNNRLIATGGDDGAITISELALPEKKDGNDGGIELKVKFQCENGHNSTVTALNWLNSNHLISAGIDGRINFWRLDEANQTLHRYRQVIASVADIGALVVVSSASDNYILYVVGAGIEAISGEAIDYT